MERGTDIDAGELDVLVACAANYIKLVIATTITLGQGSLGGLRGLSATEINALITRYQNARKVAERL